jgi:hypothetical protein
VIVASEIATATMTGATDIATYLELLSALERTATFGESAHLHLTRIADEYRQLDA